MLRLQIWLTLVCWLSAPLGVDSFNVRTAGGATTRKRTSLSLLAPGSFGGVGVVVEEIIKGIDVVREAYVPENTDSALAIALSETVAGGVSALISRGVAEVVGDRKVDGVGTKITSTSAYFGVRSVTRGAARLLGLPAPVALILASLTGSLALESTKATFRTRDEEKLKAKEEKLDQEEKIRRLKSKFSLSRPTKVARTRLAETAASKSTTVKTKPTATRESKEDSQISRLLKSIKNVISIREVEGDITKWVVFDLLVQSMSTSAVGVERNVLYFAIGSISAIAGNFVKLLPTRDLQDKAIQVTREKSLLVSYSQAALEGGVLFATYAITGPLVVELVPKSLNMDFFFNTLLTSAEQTVEKSIVESGL